MILVSDVFNSVRSLLDDDNSLRYDEQKDLVPALNRAIRRTVTIFNTALEQKKVSSESLRDLSSSIILPVVGTSTKKCDLSSIIDLWSILAVEPDPIISGGAGYEVLSETRNRFAARLTLEQWNDSLSDPFSPGTGVSILADFVRAGYLGPGQYFGDGKLYLMIRPASAFTANFVGIYYLKNPTTITTSVLTPNIELPISLHNLLVDQTLNALSLQQGPESKYGSVTDKEVSTLVSLMLS
jgi:hypothetical protein